MSPVLRDCGLHGECAVDNRFFDEERTDRPSSAATAPATSTSCARLSRRATRVRIALAFRAMEHSTDNRALVCRVGCLDHHRCRGGRQGDLHASLPARYRSQVAGVGVRWCQGPQRVRTRLHSHRVSRLTFDDLQAPGARRRLPCGQADRRRLRHPPREFFAS